MKVKKGEQLKYYIPSNLGITKKQKYELLDGKELDIKEDIVKKYPEAFIIQKVKEVKQNANK